MTTDPKRSLRSAILTIALLSASLLAFQVLLTRVCALRLSFHFGFLIISNSLLGIGASGSMLALLERRWRARPDAWIFRFCALFVASLPLCWLWLLKAPIPEKLTFATLPETLQFAAFNLACAVPFFFGGTVVGLILSAHAVHVNRVYAADLLGAGAGCVAVPFLLGDYGAGGVFLATMLLAIAGTAATLRSGVTSRVLLVTAAAVCGYYVPKLDYKLPVPGKRYLDITQDNTLREFGAPLFSKWSANSRIDVLPLPAHFPRFLQARGSKALAMPLPLQWWIGQDGDAGTMLSDFGREPDTLAVLRHTMYSASFALKQGSAPRVCVIGVGGAPDLWAAKIHDASRILGIELNQSIVDVHHGVAREFSAPLLADPRVEIVVDEGRSALMRSQERFDVIQLTGIDTWTALSSGAYVLAENYLYTVEACRTMYDRLAEGGILQITRMAAGMETIRLLNNMRTALPAAAQAGLGRSVAALRTGDGLLSVLLKKGVYTEQEVARLCAFADESGIDKVVIPGMALGTEVEEFVTAPDRDAFVAAYRFDISPTWDDRPYFFSFVRWSDPVVAREFLHQPTWIVQGNPLFLQNQLTYSSIAAGLFILLPLLFRRGTTGRSRRGAGRFLLYFAGLGVGFIAIEVALIQKFTLLLGQPLYSIVVTLCSILVFTGLGAWLSGPWLARSVRRARWIPLLVLLLLVLIALLSPWLVESCIALPLWLRCTVVAAVIAPVGLLLGMPFAHGIQVVTRINPSFVPWAWAVNGSTTVVGSIGTVIVSMNFGFAAVLLLAGAVYLLSFAAIDALALQARAGAGPGEEAADAAGSTVAGEAAAAGT